ncbi:hypothetical protein [Streptomyces sp. NBC_01618]|uniref:hypothetical protein n=1 Tax=Streptomyces sp. NBC_01618 TaxID=2975900 RepID=UPI00386EDB4D|nr:hypothetical protein OH735_17025 [Streptomyces sp. NBC_01618]
MSTRRWYGGRLLIGAASVVALTVTGCGGGGNSGDDFASASNGKTDATTSKGSSSELADYVEGQRKWVKCLRDEGFDTSDPDSKGRVDLGDKSAWKRDPKALKAQEKCASLSLPIPESLLKEQLPELSKDEIGKNRRYARCMQEHGAPDFPDTGADGHFQESAWDATSAGAKRAARVCAPIIGIPDDAPTPKG